MNKLLISRFLFSALLLFASMSLSTAQTVKGRVWNDLNNNGLQDIGEPGLGNVWVKVRNAVTNTTIPGAQGYTQADGTYSFNVPSGSYKVKISPPATGFNSVTQNVGTNDAIDSDVDFTGNSAAFAVNIGQTLFIDGGFYSGGGNQIPSISINDVTVNQNSGTASLVLSLSAPSAVPVSVQVSTADSTAIAGVDYTAVTYNFIIPAGAPAVTVVVPIINWPCAKPTIYLNVNLSSPNGATIADSSGRITILDLDFAFCPLTVTPSINGSIVLSGLAGLQSARIKITNSSSVEVFNQTYSPVPSTITIPSLPLGNYTVTGSGTSNNGCLCINNTPFSVSNNPLPSLSISDVTVNENAGTATLVVSLSAPSTSAVGVQVDAPEGTAFLGHDFLFSNAGGITLGPGTTAGTMNIPILNDNCLEGTESFTVNLFNPTGASIADGVGKITIIDDDITAPPRCATSITQGPSGSIVLNGISGSLSFTINIASNTPGLVYNETFYSFSGTFTSPPLAAGSYNVQVTGFNNAFCVTCSNTIFTVNNSAPDCAPIVITSANGAINVTGYNAPAIKVQVLNSSWQQVYSFADAPTSASMTFPNLAPGTYTVKVTLLTANWTTICKKEQKITLNSNLVASEGEDVPSVGIFPNPASERIYIALEELEEKDVQVAIINQLGQTIKEMTYLKAAPVLEFPLDGIDNGMYFLQLRSHDSRPIIRKVVVESLK